MAQVPDLMLFFLSESLVQNAGPFPGRRSDCDPLNLGSFYAMLTGRMMLGAMPG
jgi:hypothetical protein